MADIYSSAFAYSASGKCKPLLQSTAFGLLATANSLMSDPLTLYDRLMAVKPAGLSRNAWSQRAGVSRVVFNDIRNRNNARQDTIEKLLSAIGVTLAEFEAGARQAEKEPSSPEVRAPYLAFRGQDRPRDVPVVGTAECADIDFTSEETTVAVETMEMHLGDVVDHARRPATLDNRRDVYAIYFRGDSMTPRYEPGELAYVDPKRPPRAREYVIVQLRRDNGDEGEQIYVAMAKRLVRQAASFYELEQFNPPAIFRVNKGDVAHIHRIIPWEELVLF